MNAKLGRLGFVIREGRRFRGQVRGLRQFYQFKDIWYGLVKAASFGAAVALMGCIKGLSSEGGAAGVGAAATRAVVLGCEAILVLDAFWAVVLL